MHNSCFQIWMCQTYGLEHHRAGFLALFVLCTSSDLNSSDEIVFHLNMRCRFNCPNVLSYPSTLWGGDCVGVRYWESLLAVVLSDGLPAEERNESWWPLLWAKVKKAPQEVLRVAGWVTGSCWTMKGKAAGNGGVTGKRYKSQRLIELGAEHPNWKNTIGTNGIWAELWLCLVKHRGGALTRIRTSAAAETLQ